MFDIDSTYDNWVFTNYTIMLLSIDSVSFTQLIPYSVILITGLNFKNSEWYSMLPFEEYNSWSVW